MDMPLPRSAGDVIGYLREHQITLTWDPAAGTLRAGTSEDAKTRTIRQVNPGLNGHAPEGGQKPPVARRWRQPAPG
jgi:hypothetical protein